GSDARGSFSGWNARLRHLDVIGGVWAAGAEIVRLRLEDIAWRGDVLRVRHSKTGTYSELPLLREVGEAVLCYLEKVRPRCVHREVFLRLRAPHRPFKKGSILSTITRARLKTAGITRQGRKGAHAFRHARAVS